MTSKHVLSSVLPAKVSAALGKQNAEKPIHRTLHSRFSATSMNQFVSPVTPVKRPTTDSRISTSYVPTLRSMKGLLLADMDDSVVQMDVSAADSSLPDGQRITFEPVITSNRSGFIQPAALHGHPGNELVLNRDDTLLNLDASPARNAAELKSLLGNNYSRLRPGAAVLPPPSLLSNKSTNISGEYMTVALEQAKPRARVEVDIILDGDICVQGSHLKGRVRVHVRKGSKTQPPVWLAKGRVRIIGYESINDDDRHTFYQCTAPLSTSGSSTDALYISEPDEEGYAEAKDGVYVFPFAVWLPLDDSCGLARGVVQIPSGATVRYIAMISFKIKCPATNERSIAHFYRNCEIWPRMDPSVVLITAPRPLLAQASKSVFLGGKGKISLTAQLHRLHWIAGQRCYLKFSVTNDTKKIVKSLTLALIRTTTVFRPHPYLDALPGSADPDACQTSTSRKQVAYNVLEMAHGGEKGHASAKGWWTGIPANQKLDFSHFLLLPSDALSFTRVRLLEVEYTIRASLSAGSLGADVHVILPVRIINFLSIDPPPDPPLVSPEATSGRYFMRESDSHRNETSGGTVRGHRALMDGGFAGAPYSDFDSEITHRCDDCLSERSVSVYDDSSSMDEDMENFPLQRYPDTAPRSIVDTAGRPGNRNSSERARDFGNLLTAIDQPANTRPQGPRQLIAAPKRGSSPQPVLTAFELRVKEKMHALATSAVKSAFDTNNLELNASRASSSNDHMKCYTDNKLLKPPNVHWKTPNEMPGFSLPPSHQLPKPPRMITRPMLKTHLTDPGPVPIIVTVTDTSSTPASPSRSDTNSDARLARLNASRMRSQTQSMTRPPLPSRAGSAFSAVKLRIANMEEKVFELNQRTDGVVPFF